MRPHCLLSFGSGQGLVIPTPQTWYGVQRMNISDVAFALDLDLEAISARLHGFGIPAGLGPNMQDVDTILYALHSLREYVDPRSEHYDSRTAWVAELAHQDTAQAIHDDHLQNRTGG